MKLATPITIRLGSDTLVLGSIDECVGLARQHAQFEFTSAKAHQAAQCRLGAVLWQARQQARARHGEAEGFARWKRLIVMADIDEKRAQRCMRVASEAAPNGEIDLRLVEQLQERARARGCAMPFTMHPPRTFDEIERLVAAGSPSNPGKTGPTNTGRATAPVAGSDRVQQADEPVPPVPGVPGVALDDDEALCLGEDIVGEEAVAAALGISVERLRLEAATDAPALGTPTPPALSTQHSGTRGHAPSTSPRGVRGEQLSLASLYEHTDRVAALSRRVVERVRAGTLPAERAEAVLAEIEATLHALV